MKLKFKHQPYQTQAVEAVADCFAGQPRRTGLEYRVDPGPTQTHPQMTMDLDAGFRNHDIELPAEALLENVRVVQRTGNLPPSEKLSATPVSGVNLDIEMETGTGKTDK